MFNGFFGHAEWWMNLFSYADGRDKVLENLKRKSLEGG
jgi:hypothetical protein